jgi:hypothetical protein
MSTTSNASVFLFLLRIVTSSTDATPLRLTNPSIPPIMSNAEEE